MTSKQATTPTQVMDSERMGASRWFVVLLAVALNALDGFDVLSISFAAPGIAADWGIDRATLGWVLAMELLGMAAGSIVLGVVGDKLGRRTVILFCLVVMATGMFGASRASSVSMLLAWRLVTGLGIGGMLAVTAAATAEFANRRWRELAMSLVVIGYPIGGFLGGTFVRYLLVDGTWRDIFTLGAAATIVFVPLVFFLLPESPVFLDRRGGSDALSRCNRSLVRFGHPPATSLTAASEQGEKPSVMDIFKQDLIRQTLLVTAAYFSLITSFYFLVKWVPKLVVDMGFDPGAAAGVLAWLNVGGATGGALFGYLATRMDLRPLTIGALVTTAGMIYWFGSGPTDLVTLTVIVTAAGFFSNSAICGTYTLFTKVFPTHVRATGTGFAIGVGRGGAIIAPVVAGYLFQAGFGLQAVSIVMGSCALVAAALLCFLNEDSRTGRRR